MEDIVYEYKGSRYTVERKIGQNIVLRNIDDGEAIEIHGSVFMSDDVRVVVLLGGVKA